LTDKDEFLRVRVRIRAPFTADPFTTFFAVVADPDPVSTMPLPHSLVDIISDEKGIFARSFSTTFPSLASSLPLQIPAWTFQPSAAIPLGQGSAINNGADEPEVRVNI